MNAGLAHPLLVMKSRTGLQDGIAHIETESSQFLQTELKILSQVCAEACLLGTRFLVPVVLKSILAVTLPLFPG